MKKNLNPIITKELRNKVVLITGGAGSIGSEIAKTILKYPVKSVRILDINEHALFKLKRSINDNRLKFLLGDILDKNRIEMAMNYADIVINAAAIKNIEISEFNPIETINVNINGVVNLIETSLRTKPKKFLNISTDKVADASTLYGTTKQLGERLTSWAGAHIQSSKFASVRLGNVMETRGNVFEIWKEESENNQPLSITDPKMERYYFHVDEAVDFILNCILKMKQGEIFIPKMKSYKMIDLASKYSKKHKIIGLRQGEKLNEILMTEAEKEIAIEKKDMWIIQIYKRGIYLL
jgi:UDP-N-acetylglucosamine 4,6-dehydratase/5-epimerase